jgi:hypothetical protein
MSGRAVQSIPAGRRVLLHLKTLNQIEQRFHFA